MLVDRHPYEDVFARVPELAGQTDPVLVQLDRLLDDDQLMEQVRADLSRRYRFTSVHGRHSTPVEVILRLLFVRHLYHWSYQETEDRVRDSLVLRWFCRVYFARVPDDTTLLRWARTITPPTLEALNERVVQLARQAHVTHGRKLRLDGTTVQTTIHHPTDSGLLIDSVRVLTRVIQRAQPLVGATLTGIRDAFRNRLRSMRRAAQAIHRRLRQKGEEVAEQQKATYQRLIQTTEQVVHQAEDVADALKTLVTKEAQHLRQRLEEVLPLVGKVIHQARRRVLEGQTVPSSEKIVSLFEPHTRIIPRHKGGAPMEFGRHVVVDEVDGGIITRWHVLDAAASEQGEVAPALAQHQRLFGKPPRVLTGDRGLHSPGNQAAAETAGVGIVAIPWKGPPPPERRAVERTRRWKRAYRWRAGIEGRIHSLRRDFGLERCAHHGERGLHTWVGWGIVASNLRQIALATVA